MFTKNWKCLVALSALALCLTARQAEAGVILLSPSIAAGTDKSGATRFDYIFADTHGNGGSGPVMGAPITEAMIGLDIDNDPPNPDDPNPRQGSSGDGYASSANATFFIKLAASEIANGFVYAQRHGDAWGNVSSMDFWFVDNTDPNAGITGFSNVSLTLPSLGSPDETVTINARPADGNCPLELYDFGGDTYDAQYAYVKFNGTVQSGGYEFRFVTPEPATMALLGLGGLGLILNRKRR